MNTTGSGQRAERAVAGKLIEDGYEIIGQNWRTSICEIDIVAQKDKVIYFVEAKYRSTDKQGVGFDYITERKIKQLKFAAENWCQQTGWTGDWRLMAASVDTYDQVELIELE